MSTVVRKSVLINAPVEKIFQFTNDPGCLMEVWPNMIEAKNIEHLPNGGVRFNWIYKTMGVRMEGVSEDIEIIPNQKQVSATSGGIESRVTWAYEPQETGTLVHFENEYKVPIPLVGKLAEAAILKINEQEAETLLANLKIRMEA